MYDESMLFVGPDEGECTAPLLFPATQPLSLRAATHELVFEEGREFALDSDAGIIIRLPGSRIPCTPQDDVPGLVCAKDDDFHRRQVSATYAHRPGTWNGYTPAFAGGEMPRTFRRLAASEPLRLAITGDSISEGYNASEFILAPPRQPAYGPLVAAGLEQAYGSRVELHNCAVAGWTSDDGLADVGRVAAWDPHLVIVAYGMNDAGYAAPADFARNVRGIIEAVRATSPLAEFVVVSPMLPIAEPDDHALMRFPAYRDALLALCDDGVVLADLTTLWTDLLGRKRGYDLTGNGLNHPNDFGHRLYAQVILALLVARDRLTAVAGK
jgi:lysophospholipase L1-like esterase